MAVGWRASFLSLGTFEEIRMIGHVVMTTEWITAGLGGVEYCGMLLVLAVQMYRK